MKNLSNFAVFVSIVSIVITAILCLRYSSDHKRISQLGEIIQLQKAIAQHDSVPTSEAQEKIANLNRLLEVQAVKEDHYLNQLGVLSDWIILYVTGIFLVISIVGYLNFTSNIKKLEIEAIQRENFFIEQFANFEKRFIQLEADLFRSAAFSMNIFAHNHIRNKEWYSAFNMALNAIHFYALAYRIDTSKDKKAEIRQIEGYLSQLAMVVENWPNIVITKSNYEQCSSYFREMLIIYDHENIQRGLFDVWKEIENKLKIEKE